jgi:hypothetical protein
VRSRALETVRVVCVKFGTKYGAEWVIRLRNMVARHLPCAHEFVCYTEAPVEGVVCQPLPSSLPGWWAKVGLFKPGLSAGETLYLDLDVVIRGDIGAIRRTDDGKVWALDDFSYSLTNPREMGPETRRLLGGVGTCNSSVLYWRGDAGRRVWDAFTPGVMERLHGDQNWITQALWPHTLALFETGVACSYKYHLLHRLLEEGSTAPIVVFHGEPKAPSLERTDPLRKLWEAA